MIINKQGTFRPFATPVCVYPPPFFSNTPLLLGACGDPFPIEKYKDGAGWNEDEGAAHYKVRVEAAMRFVATVTVSVTCFQTCSRHALCAQIPARNPYMRAVVQPDRGTLKMRDVNMRHRKTWHNLARAENAGHENTGPCRQGGKCAK